MSHTVGAKYPLLGLPPWDSDLSKHMDLFLLIFLFQSTQYRIQWSAMNALKCLLNERINVDKQKVIIVRIAFKDVSI